MNKDAAEIKEFRSGLEVIPTPELRQMFKGGLQVVRDELLRTAAILQELESRGESVEGDTHLLNMLRNIASGQLLVDVVVRFASKPYTLQGLAKLSPEEQAAALEQDDEETHKKARRQSKSKVTGSGSDARPSLKEIAEVATIKDLVDMCIDLVRHCKNPVHASAVLIQRLQAKEWREAS